MNIIAFSDSHNMHWDKRLDLDKKYISGIHQENILVHAGDFGVHGGFGEVHSFFDFLIAYAPLFKAIIFICGNHDSAAEMHPQIFKTYLKDLPDNVHYLQCHPVTINNIKFFGCPHTIEYHGGFNMKKEDLDNHWDLIPDKTDILVTHSPPYGIMDLDKIKLGSVGLLEKVKEIKPKLHIFGHIHPGSGTFQTQDTMFVNAAVVGAHNYNITHSVKIIPWQENAL